MAEKQNKLSKHHQLISLSQSWHQWWDIFSHNFLKWTAISFLPWFFTYMIIILLLGKLVLAMREIDSWNELFSFQNNTIYFLFIGFLMVISLQLIGSLALIIGALQHRRLIIKQTFIQAVRFFWDYLLMSIFVVIIYILVFIISYFSIAAIGSILGLINLSLLTKGFAWLKLIPFVGGLFINILFVFAPYDLVDKKSSPWRAIKNSFLLIKGHFWPVTVRLFIAYIIFFTFALLLNLIVWIGPLLAALLTAPALTIYLYIIYRNLRLLKKV